MLFVVGWREREKNGVVSAQFLAEVSSEGDVVSLHALRVIKCEWNMTHCMSEVLA
jgi:hypothetical protein